MTCWVSLSQTHKYRYMQIPDDSCPSCRQRSEVTLHGSSGTRLRGCRAYAWVNRSRSLQPIRIWCKKGRCSAGLVHRIIRYSGELVIQTTALSYARETRCANAAQGCTDSAYYQGWSTRPQRLPHKDEISPNLSSTQ